MENNVCVRPRRQQQRQQPIAKSALALSILAASVPATLAQNCISLAGSTACPAFANASISTSLTGLFPFLSFVSDRRSFDDRLRQYISTDYARAKYQQLLGCSSVNLTNTTDIYARYTTSVICNSIVQNSAQTCGLSRNNSRPLCADSCAQFAISEQQITASPELCGNSGQNAINQIRADFTNCALPADSLSGSCVFASANEPTECGYQSNLQGLCSFCATSSPNATDACCYNANAQQRCKNVHLPTLTSMPPLFTTTSTVTSSATAGGAAAGAGNRTGLSGGQIAGIVVGSLLGAALILGAVIFFCLHLRKRRQSQHGSILNTPSPSRQAIPGPQMSYTDGVSPPVIPGGRVARMSALEGSSSSGHHSSRGGALAAYHDDSSNAYSSPESDRNRLGALPKRDGSLSPAHSGPRDNGYSSPHSGSDPDRNFSSPEGVASGQSEQLGFFKDYYSQDDIHPNDTVATLWAYQPRANDEFELERGDMLKVVGIWDDGWATGVKLSESVDQWEARRQLQRDSGVSNGSRQSGVVGESEIKAFPLVCVCLPQHWRKTIEGDTTDTTGGGSGGDRPPSP